MYVPRVSIVFLFLVDQNLYYRILTIKLVNQKRNYNGDSRYIEHSQIQQQTASLQVAAPHTAVPGLDQYALNPEPLNSKP